MSDSTDRPKTGELQNHSVMTPESLRESLDELANNVDSLVDRLTMDMTDSPVEDQKQPQPKASPAPPPVAALELETDDELFGLAEEMIESLTSRTKTPLKPVAAPTQKQAGAVLASKRSVLPWDDEPVDPVMEVTVEQEVDAMADLMVDSLTSESGELPDLEELEEGLELDLSEEIDSVPPTGSDLFADHATPAAQTVQPVEVPSTASVDTTPWARPEVPIRRQQGSGRWMRIAAAGIMIGVAASVAWVMLGRRTSTTETTNRVAAPPQTIKSLVPAVQAQSPGQPPTVSDPSPAPQQAAPSTPTEPVAKPRSTPKPRPVVPQPRAEPIVETAETKPKPTRVFPPPPPKAAEVTPEPEPKPVEPVAAKPDPEPVAVAALTPRPTPPPTTTTTASTPSVDAGTTGPPVVGEIQPPELVSRQEAIYPEKSRKRGESGVVVLKVLVNEKGRVARVVIEQGIRGSDLEARAIDAALRSVYRPATQDGHEVRAWVTERFVFEP